MLWPRMALFAGVRHGGMLSATPKAEPCHSFRHTIEFLILWHVCKTGNQVHLQFTNPFETRGSQSIVILDPLASLTSPGSIKVHLGGTATYFGVTTVALEGFSRALWGLATLPNGGGNINVWRDVFTDLGMGLIRIEMSIAVRRMETVRGWWSCPLLVPQLRWRDNRCTIKWA
jgi:hypothetical protein